MSDLAWMKTYIGDEAAVTGHLTAEEFGAYERLRRHFWQHGQLPEDDARLSRIIGLDPDRWQNMASAIVPLMANAMAKLERERTEAASRRAKRVAAGKAGAAAKWGSGNNNGNRNADANGKGMANAMAKPMPLPRAPAPAPDEERYEERLVPAGQSRISSQEEYDAYSLERETRRNAYAAAKGGDY